MTPGTTGDAMLEYARLRPALGSLRMRYANLLAAARATLTAARDGDANPLAYLIDELGAQGQLPPLETGSPIFNTDGLTAWTAWLDPTSASADGWNQR
ncbi:MAG: hypothetical protein JO281_09830 [Pseudonocardiales bacterium]|nr:hypothetical protein [Pseudonocardiales bacterium]